MVTDRAAGLAVAVALFAVVGCSAGGRSEPVAVCTSQAFDLEESPEVLGSGKRLIEEFGKATDRQVGTVTMAEIAGRAGWSLDWDRAVSVYSDTTVDSVNEAAGTNLAPGCLKGLPGKWHSVDSVRMSTTYTVFVKDSQPVQAVHWLSLTPDFEMWAPYITPESELTCTLSSCIAYAR